MDSPSPPNAVLVSQNDDLPIRRLDTPTQPDTESRTTLPVLHVIGEEEQAEASPTARKRTVRVHGSSEGRHTAGLLTTPEPRTASRLNKSALEQLGGGGGRKRGRSGSVWSHISFAEGLADPAESAERSKGRREVHVLDTAQNISTSNFLVTSHYTLLTFLPLNLWEQFQQISNCYFLVNMIIALIPGVSPITPITAVLPMIIVLTIAAAKNGFEDWKRHRADTKDNSSPTTVLRDGAWVVVESREIRVGDIVRLQRGDSVKADVVVLSSSDEDCVVYIETSQLDGETNIKPRKGRHETSHVQSVEQLSELAGKMMLEVDTPNDKLYRWQGVLNYVDKHPLSAKQAIWRGSSIRKTVWACGVVVYTGKHTKQGMNLKKKGRKQSKLVRKLNLLIIVIFLIKHVLMFLLCGLSVWWASRNEKHWYVRYFIDKFSSTDRFFLNYLTFFILFSFLIPISLFVTVEFCKGMQIMLMVWDQTMFRWVPQSSLPEGGEWLTCRPKTSDLNEQLAVIKYIFSDKTGTLTENIMRYVQGVVGSTQRTPAGDRTWVEHVEVTASGAETPGELNQSGGGKASAVWGGSIDSTEHGLIDDVARFAACMALCHSVVPFQQPDGSWCFEGASPDEVALVRCAEHNGFLLTKRTSKEVEIKVDGRSHTFDVVEELEFTPTRKMMSVLLRDSMGRILLLAKGADASVLPRLEGAGTDGRRAELSRDDSSTINAHLASYGSRGLRTLCLAWRIVPEGEFSEWNKRYSEAQTSLDRTDAMIDDLCLELEAQLHLAGVAAYEDKLQDGVPETIRFFVNAGVVVWMLTGDKLETGIEIGRTCGLLCPASDELPEGGKLHLVELSREIASDPTLLDDPSLPQEEREGRRLRQCEIVAAKLQVALDLARAGARVTLAIDGVSLDLALDDRNLRLFVEVCTAIYSAVCCRLTPSQKGRIVDLFQKESGETALAIGDGANDATMIGAAKVGIGIIGLEGSQAELASDYAIPRFRHLKRLVVVHGRYALYRNALCACFSFYKNLVLTMGQFYFALYCGFSGTTVYDSWLLAVKNTFFTFLPPFFMGCFEKDIHEEALEDHISGPPLFRQLSRGKYFDTKSILAWFGVGFVHGTLIFFFTLQTLELQDWDTRMGRTAGLPTSGTTLMSAVVYCVLLKGLLHLRHVTAVQIAGTVISAIFYPLFLVLYSSIDSLFGESQYYKVSWEYLSDPKSYLYILLLSVGVLLPLDWTALAAQRDALPSLRDLWQRYDAVDPRFRRLYDASHPEYKDSFGSRFRLPIAPEQGTLFCGCSSETSAAVGPRPVTAGTEQRQAWQR